RRGGDHRQVPHGGAGRARPLRGALLQHQGRGDARAGAVKASVPALAIVAVPPEDARNAQVRRILAMTDVHPFYESQRAQIEESMRERLDLAEPFLRAHLGSVEMQQVRAEVMAELATVLQQMPYVGGKESRMTDFFVQLLGFMAIGRVLRRKPMPPKLIGEIGLQSYKAQLLKMPLAQRLEAGRQFMSPENQALLRTQAAASQDEKYPEDFVYDFVEPGPTDTFDFGINYRACGFC